MQEKIRKMEERKMSIYKKKSKKQKKVFSFNEKKEYYNKRAADEKLPENKRVYAVWWKYGVDDTRAVENIVPLKKHLKHWKQELREANTLDRKNECKEEIVRVRGMLNGAKARAKEERKKWQNKK